jgi:hypothetical protein
MSRVARPARTMPATARVVTLAIPLAAAVA